MLDEQGRDLHIRAVLWFPAVDGKTSASRELGGKVGSNLCRGTDVVIKFDAEHAGDRADSRLAGCASKFGKYSAARTARSSPHHLFNMLLPTPVSIKGDEVRRKKRGIILESYHA